MVLTSLQANKLIKRFNHLKINQPIQMAAGNNVISPFEGNIKPRDPMGITIYLEETKEIDKETDKLYISV